MYWIFSVLEFYAFSSNSVLYKRTKVLIQGRKGNHRVTMDFGLEYIYCALFRIYVLLAVCSWVCYLTLLCLSCLVNRREMITPTSSGCSALTRHDRIWKVLAQQGRHPTDGPCACWHTAGILCHSPCSHWQPISHLIWGVTQFEALVAKFK